MTDPKRTVPVALEHARQAMQDALARRQRLVDLAAAEIAKRAEASSDELTDPGTEADP